jgi:hypothetical protein
MDGQFPPETRWSVCSGKGVKNSPFRGGQFVPESGGQFDRILHTWGLGFTNFNGVWKYLSTFYFGPPSWTFLQHVNVCEDEALGIKELSPGSIALYPNPATDVVNIVSINDIRTIEILDFLGQTIYKTNNVNLKVTKLDLTSFSAGEYLVKITTMNEIQTTKITVIH